MDKDYSPLSSACVKNLTDKLFEKRKLASAEVERIVRECFGQDRKYEITKVVGYFGNDFILSANPLVRKGGLLGLASVAIGLNQNTALFHGQIILPIIRTLHDNDSQVRYYACEALYNVMKITKSETVNYLSEIFDAISRGVADSDASVRQGALQCDRLLKEIIVEPNFFNLSDVVLLLRERIYTNNQYARQFIVSWVNTLYSIPGLTISTYLPQLLDGLFRILGDPNPDIRRQCELLLSDILSEIRSKPDEVSFDTMINHLLVHCRLSATATALNDNTLKTAYSYTAQINAASSVVVDSATQSVCLTQNPMSDNRINANGNVTNLAEQLQQRTALIWIRTFVELDPHHLLPFVSGIIGAVLPCFFLYELAETFRDRRDTLETAIRINELLLQAVSNATSDSPLNHAISGNDNGDELPFTTVTNDPDSLMNPPQLRRNSAQKLLKKTDSTPTKQALTIHTDAILKATCDLLNHQSILTRLAALRWIGVLADVQPVEVYSHFARLLPLLLKLVSDPADEMIHSAIWLVGRICHHSNSTDYCDILNQTALVVPVELVNSLQFSSIPDGKQSSIKSNSYNPFCLKFLLDLVDLFNKDIELLNNRGDMIITDFCQVLGANTVYQTISAIISNRSPIESTFVLVQALNRILLTQPMLHSFRNQLRAIKTKEQCQLFERLYRAWCHNPVALLSLCLLTENYEHCSRLIKSFGDIVITVEVLCDMDQLIQLIESPIFATLRMHMLDRRFSAHLRATLYCLLMCLPQTDAFQILWRRLQCLPPLDILSDDHIPRNRVEPNFQLMNDSIDFDKLFDHFHAIQKLHNEYRMRSNTAQSMHTFNAGETNRITDGANSNNNNLATNHTSATDNHLLDNSTIGSAESYLIQSFSRVGIRIGSVPVMEHFQ